MIDNPLSIGCFADGPNPSSSTPDRFLTSSSGLDRLRALAADVAGRWVESFFNTAATSDLAFFLEGAEHLLGSSISLPPFDDRLVQEDLGESDLVNEFNSIVPSSFITELKSAKTDEYMLDVSVLLEFDFYPCTVTPTLSEPPACPLSDDFFFFFLSSSDDIESEPASDPEPD